MLISYTVKLTVLNNITNASIIFNKNFESEITGADNVVYDNYHVIRNCIYVLDLFSNEVEDYCKSANITVNDIIIDEYELATLTERVEVFFENSVNPNEFTLSPDIKCYIYPKEDPLPVPELKGTAYDSTTIIWTWPNDEEYAHYLISEPIDLDSEEYRTKIIATLPIGTKSYIETNLEPNTRYSRRLINFTSTQTSMASGEVTVTTETVNPKVSLDKYFIERNHDWTIDDSERETVKENLEAFKSGIGDFNDLKVYKQMDNDFYEKFKAYFTLTGKYTQREKRYENVGFNYKICLEAKETIEEQEGEVTFKLDAYPWQEIYKTEYVWATKPVTVQAKVYATVDLYKEAPDNEFKDIEKETYWEETITTPSSPLTVVLSLDLSSSMAQTINQNTTTTRLDLMKIAAKKAIDKVHTLCTSGGANISYSFYIVAYGENVYCTNKITNVTDAKSVINSITVHPNHGGTINGNSVGAWTNWHKGLKGAASAVRNITGTTKMMLFFTDGFPNKGNDSNGEFRTEKNQNSYTRMCASIVDGIEHSGMDKIYALFCCNVGSSDTQWPTPRVYNEAVRDAIKNYRGSIKIKSKTITMESNDMNKSFEDAIMELAASERQEHHGDNATIHIPVLSTEHKRVNIESETLTFTFDSFVTPVAYNATTNKAEIINTLSPIKMSEKSILQLLTEAIERTPEWQEGFKTNPTTENGAVFTSIYIKDTYSYGEQDTVGAFNAFYDYGMAGTVNVNATVHKLSTTDNTDDEYEATDDSFVYISGYTNGIIYDCTRYGHAALNAYNRPNQTIFNRNDLGSELRCRVNKNITYGYANIDSGHVFKKELELKTPNPCYVQIYGDGIDYDMSASISVHWESPQLNYRFNLLDPDAFTPYNEILPACNPNSLDKNVIILTVYYAKNVEINSTSLNSNYYALFDYTNPAQSPLVFRYGLNATWNYQNGVFDCDGHWITQYLHFFARKMKKTQDYYDEIPGPNMDKLYGMVNGRYRESNQSGKLDLVVDTPKFNIPTTVLGTHSDTIKIYIRITETYPASALVSYKWKHETSLGSGITQINGDYVTFSSDSLTYKDVEYKETLATYETKQIEMFNQEPLEMLQPITKPVSNRIYTNYLLDIKTNNGDVLATRYPTEIIFNSDEECVVPVIYRGIINATSKWSPRIHNGYYYINQHEKYLYSEFDAKADFDKTDITYYEDCTVFLNISVHLQKSGGSIQHYNILKNSIVDLLQDEDHYVWVPDKGLTLKPVIEGERYKYYEAQEWISPVILFNNPLTSADTLNIDYINTDGSNTGLDLYVRSYDLELGQWTEWVPFTNHSVPNTVLSCGYQVKTILSATMTHTNYTTEDYLCCYLDWVDYIDDNVSQNIVTITDHITTDLFENDGIAISKIISYACPTVLNLSIFSSTNRASLLISFSNNADDLILENAKWYTMNEANLQSGYKFYRFKIVFPKSEKIYWVHMKVKSLETNAVLPYIKSIQMNGTYIPSDITNQFLKLDTYTILKDGFYHNIISSIKEYIEPDVIKRGFQLHDITSLEITSTNPDTYLLFDNDILLPTPDETLLDSPIDAAAAEATINTITNLPYIFTDHNVITISGTPQQYSPITVEDSTGTSFKQIYNANKEDMSLTEVYTIQKHENFLELKRTDFELDTIRVWVNDDEITDYSIVNHLLMFKNFLNIDDVITISYNVKNSFIVSIDRILNTTKLLIYTNKEHFALPDEYDENIDGQTIRHRKKYKVMFETNQQNNKFVAKNLSLNPVYRTDYSGFIYMTEEHYEPYKINIWCNPNRIKSGGYDSVDIQVEILDILNNPVIGKEVKIDCKNGIINSDNFETDMNGIVHVVYRSSTLPGTDIVTAKVLLDDELTNLQNSIEIISY